MSQRRIRQLLLLIVTVPLLFISIYLAYNVYHNSFKRAEIKEDYAKINSIYNGILSVNAWKKSVINIVESQIDEFELTESQDSALQAQLTNIIRNLVDKADRSIQVNDEGFKGKIRKWAVNIFVNKEKIKAQAPHFSREIIDEVLKKKNKEKLKVLAVSKLKDFSQKTYDLKDSAKTKKIYTKYNIELEEDISAILLTKAKQLEVETYQKSYMILGIVGVFLFLWLLVFKYNELRKPLFFMSIALAIAILIVGLTSTMIEIDARINQVNIMLLGEHIHFKDQVIFYRSKSILQLVEILLRTGKLDTILVGILVLCFSILLPILKLLSAEVYLFGKEKWQSNRLLKWLAFQSGKWSMADVIVVAIFMAYVGFNGILDNQMEDLNIKTDSLTSIATNNTSLQPGYILFTTFVIFSLILSVILKKILKRQEK